MAQELKFKVDKLTLETGQAITIPDPLLIMQPPTLQTLGLLGQINFYTAAVLLAYPSRIVKIDAENSFIELTDFDILMQVMRAEDDASRVNASLARTLLTMLFPQYEIQIAGNMMLFNKKDGGQSIMTAENYEYTRQAIIQVFKLDEIAGNDTAEKKEDTPMVKRIKEKLRKRHEILSRKKNGSGEMDILSRYMSIVSVGLQIPLTVIRQYTVYELFDIYKRSQLKDGFDLYIKRATSFGGVKKDEKVENWQKDLDEPPDS